ncbi:MAG: HAD family hydrolase [Candidatus Omnitrophica bacterium]|nr:HAD family hydrolase [Candidatus Omnitrophota bacterium]
MKDIKLIIFDLDGTLVDAYPAIIKSFNYAMRKMGYPVQDDLTVRRAVGWGDENLLRPFVKPSELYKAVLIYRKHHKGSLLSNSRLLPQVNRTLSLLKKSGYKLAVASNRPTRFSWILIRHLKLDKYLDYVLCADRLRHIKPNPEILLKIMRKFKLKPAQVIYVGDMSIDIQAARRAGIKAVAVKTGSHTEQELRKENPLCIIKEISQLVETLEDN